VCDEPHTIIVHRKHMALWIAYGMYMDKPLRAEDRTETGSISGWREAKIIEHARSGERDPSKLQTAVLRVFQN